MNEESPVKLGDHNGLRILLLASDKTLCDLQTSFPILSLLGLNVHESYWETGEGGEGP